MAAGLRLLLVSAATWMALSRGQSCNDHGFYCVDEHHFQECPGEGLPPAGNVNDCGGLFCSMDCEIMCQVEVPCTTTTTTEVTTVTTELPTTTSTSAPFPCESAGSFADPDDCRRFFSCVPKAGGGFWTLRLLCPEGSLFDAAEGRCSVNASCLGGGGGGCNEFGFRCVDATHGQLCPDAGLPPQGEVFECPQGAACREDCPYLCWSDADVCPTTPPPTTPPPDFVCDAEGKYADPEDCAAFYVCVLRDDGSFATLHPSCPDGSGFDVVSGRCSGAAPCRSCNDHGFRCVDANHVQVCDGDAPSGAVVECPSGTSCRSECPLECWSDADVCPTEPPPTTTTPPPPESECGAEGRFPDPEDCSRYFVCSPEGGATPARLVRVDFECPPGTSYDEASQRCGRDVPCGDACNAQGFFCVDDTHVRLCERGQTRPAPGAATVRCPSGTTCDMQCLYECWGDDVGTPCPVFKCEEQGRFPAPNNCTNFYVCSLLSNGDFFQLLVPCPAGSHFDAASAKCTSEGVCPTPST